MGVLDSNLSSVVWLVATQYLLYAIGWGVCAAVLREHRAAVAQWSVFMLLLGLGMALTALRDEPRTWWAYGGANAALFAGFVLLRRGAEAFMGIRGHDREHALTLALGVSVFLAMGADPAWSPARILLAYLGGIWILLRSMVVLRRPVQQEFGRIASWWLSVPALVVMAAFGARALQQGLDLSQAFEMHRPTPGNRSMFFGYLVSASLYNIAFVALLTMRLTQRLQRLSESDPLTGLANRRAFEQRLAGDWARWRRGASPPTLLALDIDHFKRINDGFGHEVGDAVLVEVARRLLGAARDADLVSRTGGEEFVVIMALTTPDGAHAAAERLRRAVSAAPVQTSAGPLAVTVSVGVAQPRPGETDAAAALRRADEALYGAKQAGRDRVCLAACSASRAALAASL